MLLIAHRGGTDQHPELTLESAACSLSIGASYAELDIRFTLDNVPVISHDADALRLYGVNMHIDAMTAEQFAAMRHIDHPHCRAHTLAEVLESGIGPILFHVKEGGAQLDAILQLVRHYDYERRVVMGVTKLGDVERVKAFNGDIAVLAFMESKPMLDTFLRSPADIVRLWEGWLEPDDVARVHAAGKRLWVMSGAAEHGTEGYPGEGSLALWKRLGVDGVLIDKVEAGLAYR